MERKSEPYYHEETLLERIKEKDGKALLYLYDAYGSSLYGMLCSMLGNQPKAEEVLLLTFVRTFEEIEDFDPKKRKLFTYMMNIARNLAKEYRSNENSRHVAGHHLNQSPAALVNQTIQRDFFADLSGTLSTEQEEIFRVVYMQGYSCAEAARKKGGTLANARGMLRVAMLKIRELLQQKS